MKKNIFRTLLLGTLTVFLASCGGSNLEEQATQTEEPAPEVVEETTTTETTEEPVEIDYSSLEEVGLNMNIALGNTQRTLTYNQSTPLVLPDGATITSGDIKPMWQHIGNELSINFQDITIQDQKATEMIDLAAATGFTDANFYGGNGIADKLMAYGAEGYFHNLNEYMDKMPNLAAYLNENPSIKSMITAFDGGIYHIPYIPEIGNYARVYLARDGFITALLDNETLEETSTLDVAYEAYWAGDKSPYETNVIELQNAAAANGTLTQADARAVLIDYINNTYDYENPSELYLGENAFYNMDELVALLRVIKLSPDTLSEVATGEVVEDAIISPFFVRQSKYREDLLRFINYFGGEKVYGSDSYNSKFYIAEDGTFTFSYNEDGFYEGLEKLQQMFSEGLIHAEFNDLNNTENFRTTLVANDESEAHKQFGFMTNDWIASTTAINDKMVGVLPPVTTLGSDTEFVHYIENTRTVKPDGWSVSLNTTDEELDRALLLMDSFFSPEGYELQSYGLPSFLEEGEKFAGPDGKDYPKYNSWIFDAAGEYKSGDVSGFLRDFVGSLIPIGFQKDIGFEYQYTSEQGFDAWALYNNANVLMPSYNAIDNYFKLAPTFISFNSQDLTKLSNVNIGDLQVENIFMYITGNTITSTDEVRASYEDNGIDLYISTYQEAYERTLN